MNGRLILAARFHAQLFGGRAQLALLGLTIIQLAYRTVRIFLVAVRGGTRSIFPFATRLSFLDLPTRIGYRVRLAVFMVPTNWDR